MKRFALLIALLAGGSSAMAADGTIQTWTGVGPRRNSTEMELLSSPIGSSATLRVNSITFASDSSSMTSASSSSNSQALTSSNSANAMTINSYGVPSGGLQNASGGALNITLHNISEGLVIYSSVTDSQSGSSMLAITNDAPLYNDPLLWIHNVGSLSNPAIRIDDAAPDVEMINTSTDNAHGLGKWEPMAVANLGVNLQHNSRAWDNSTFENVAEWLPLTQGGGLTLAAPTSANSNPATIQTAPLLWNTTDASIHQVGLRGPQTTSTSWTFQLPSTISNGGQVMYQATSNAPRNWEFTTGGAAGQLLSFQGTSSAPVWASTFTSISVTTNTATTRSLGILGSVQTLPTSGYPEGTMAYQLSDHVLYVATQTVVAAGSWKAAW